MRTRSPLAVALAAALAASVAAGGGAPQAAAAENAGPRLKAFSSCGELVRYGRRYARRAGANDAPPPAPGDGRTPGVQGAPGEAAPVAGDDFSPTNVQEAGIDEPDVVKTDGRHVFAIAGGRLHAVDPRSGVPRVVGSLDLGGAFGGELLLRGDRALVVGQPGGGIVPLADAASIAPDYRQETTLTEVDISDPSSMRVLRTLTVDGNYVTARQRGRTARVVFVSAPRALDPPPPEPGPAPPTPVGGGVEPAPGSPPATASRHRPSDWRPSAVLRTRRTGRRVRRPLARCRAIRRPEVFSGLDMVTVLTIDLDRGLPAVDSDAIMAGAETVYGSDRSLYVATQRFLSPDTPADRVPRGTTTAIHRFAASDAERTDYRSSGEVKGFVLNQFSLSEHRGALRVATTEAATGFPGEPRADSESFVTVLDEREGRLVELGRVGGLGRGERIYAVRFIEDAGFVVTFRQVDPLYTLDLSDPERPRVRGELKILGFSSYLHPIGNDLLLGVGQDATEEGRTRGTQVSLFDVSDLREPRRLHQRAIGDSSSSQVEYDHRAFLWWPPARLAVLPVQIYGASDVRSSAPPFAGAIGFGVGRDAGISERGRISHPGEGFSPPITRSLVVAGRLLTLSDAGVRASNLETLADEGFVAFPSP